MSGVSYPLICVFLTLIQHSPTQTCTQNRHTLTHKHSTLNVGVSLGENITAVTNRQKAAAASGEVGGLGRA